MRLEAHCIRYGGVAGPCFTTAARQQCIKVLSRHKREKKAHIATSKPDVATLVANQLVKLSRYVP